ncbi:MAG: hypothetical protein WAS33_07600 [Candidatus Promineifilaceae bacterium]
MQKNFHRNHFISILILALLFVSACGGTTTEQLQEAASSNQEDEVIEAQDESESQEGQIEAENSETEKNPTEISATNTPEPTEPSPTATSAPTEPPPTSTPEPEPITIVSQGFGQNDRSIGYSFLIKNPNVGLAFEDSQYQLAALDESGAIVDTDSGFIALLLPEQKLGIGGTLFVDEGVTVSSIQIQLNAGSPQATESIPNFTVELPTYVSGDFFSYVNGIIQSPYNRDFSNIRVSTIVYNAEDEIIGGGYTYVNFILANESTGVSVSVESNGEVARAELYPVLSGLSLFQENNDLPENTEPLSLINEGFGQDERSAGYGFLIENPNIGHTIENSQYRITFYSADGTVLETDEGYINIILPEQELGIGGEIFLDESQVIDSIETQIIAGNYIETSEELPQLTSENVTYSQGSFSSQVTGFIASPYSQDITNLLVSAILFDENGNIIGGGYTYLDFAAANSNSAVEVSVTTNGVPESVELYALPTSLSDFE